MRTVNPWNPRTWVVKYNPLDGLLAGRRLAQRKGLLGLKAPWQDDPDADKYAKGEERLFGEDESRNYHLHYGEANLVTSAVNDDKSLHQLAIDVDLPAIMFESQSGEGHYHLYINTPEPIPAKDYFKLLKMLAKVGIIEEGYYGAAKAKGYTALRVPPMVNDLVAGPAHGPRELQF